jgi:hypothetical protein
MKCSLGTARSDARDRLHPGFEWGDRIPEQLALQGFKLDAVRPHEMGHPMLFEVACVGGSDDATRVRYRGINSRERRFQRAQRQFAQAFLFQRVLGVIAVQQPAKPPPEAITSGCGHPRPTRYSFSCSSCSGSS